MHRFTIGAVAAGMFAATALGPAGLATAAPLGGSNASVAVDQLQAQGYDVQINGDQSAPLSECTVTGISGLSGTNSSGHSSASRGSTVYVGVDCNDDHDE
jgi:hypothetical protein